MVERLVFPTSYEAVPVPDDLLVSASITDEIARVQTEFFEEIISSLQISKLAEQSLCKLNVRRLEGESYIAELWMEDLQALATVEKTIDENGRNIARFTKQPLMPETIETINEIETVDGIIGDTID